MFKSFISGAVINEHESRVTHVFNVEGNLFESFLHSQPLLRDECIIVSSRLAFVDRIIVLWRMHCMIA